MRVVAEAKIDKEERGPKQSKRLSLPKDSLIRPTGKIRTKGSNRAKKLFPSARPQECGAMIEYYLKHDEETWHGSRA